MGGTYCSIAAPLLANAKKGFIAVFSKGDFPDASIVLVWVREEDGGNVYRWSEKDMEGWLCPALFMYFDHPPEKLYVQVKAIERGTGVNAGIDAV